MPKKRPLTSPTENKKEAALSITHPAARELTPAIWRMIGEMSPVMYKSRLFGMTTPDAAAAIMLKGYELGLSMTASFEFIQVIQGKPTLSPRGAMAILLSSAVVRDIQIKRLEKNGGAFYGYECTMTRDSGFTHTSRWTMDDATRAGLIKPDSGWMKYPENMCLWRAVGFAADVVAPDVTAGMTTLMKAPEAYGVALSEQGDVIDAPAVSVAPALVPDANITVLLERWSAEEILEANDGKIPATAEEVDAVRKKLESRA